MHLSSYQDIIENKIEEWQNSIANLEKRAKKAGEKDRFEELIGRMRSAVQNASLELRDLDQQENAENTLDIKDKILKIFDTIDRDFAAEGEKTPFML